MQDSQHDAPVGDVRPVFNSIGRGGLKQAPSPRRTRFYSGYTRIRTVESFQYRNFRMLWAAMLCMSVAGWVINVTTGWLAYQLTNSPLLTGLAIGMGALPPILVAPIAGVLIDSLDRRTVMVLAMVSFAAFIAAFGVIVILGIVEPWHIFVMSFLTGVSGSFLAPAEQALLPNVVPKRLLVNAFALVALAGSVTRLIAPAAAGFLIVLIGPGETLMLATVFVLVAIKVMLLVQVTNENRHSIRPKTVLTDLAEGARYLRRSKIVLAMTVLTGALLLFVTPINMGIMPVFASEVFLSGPQILGLLVAALGAGMTVGTIALASIGETKRRGRIVIVSGSLTALGLIAFSQSGSLLMAFPVLILYGGTMVITWTILGAIVQTVVPDKLRGRVAALSATVHVVFPIGTLFIGGLAELYGAPMATLISGLTMLVVVFTIPFVFREVWNFRSDENSEEPDADEGLVIPPETLEPQTA